MTNEKLEHESSKTPESQRITDGAQAIGASEGFPDRDRPGILVHDSTYSIRRSGNGMAASDPIPVIDVFAGPGGLSEGFSAARFRGQRTFRIALSIEKDPDAHATLFRAATVRKRSSLGATGA